jgi:hypothetical protein
MADVSKHPSFLNVVSWLEFCALKLAYHKVIMGYYIDADINFANYSLQEKFREF